MIPTPAVTISGRRLLEMRREVAALRVASERDGAAKAPLSMRHYGLRTRINVPA